MSDLFGEQGDQVDPPKVIGYTMISDPTSQL